MKITNYEVIQNGEQELIDAITADLDWEAIEEIFRQKHKLKLEDNVEYKKGDIVVYDGRIAYQLEFDVNIVLSVLLDREGKYIAVASSGDLDTSQDECENGMINDLENESEDSCETVLAEIASPDTSENNDEASSLSRDKDPQEKISEIVTQAEKMVSEVEADDQALADTA